MKVGGSSRRREALFTGFTPPLGVPHTIQTVCTILLAWRAHPGVPIVLAANRDELIARPSQSPGVLQTHPLVLGGRDLVAGGTWLAVGIDGTLCAVTNRRPPKGLRLHPIRRAVPGARSPSSC
jgi:hypothetical protein